MSLEGETPTLMRNRLSNALLFNYIRAVGAEACLLAEAVNATFILSLFFQIFA